jgi:hypothetical protein
MSRHNSKKRNGESMPGNDVFRVNSPQVIAENIDGEVVLVNLEKGIYYSTDQVGADLWGLIEAGRSVREIHEAICARYDADGGQIAMAVSSFLSELRSEELIVAAASPQEEGKRLETSSAGAVMDRPRFRPPTLNKYTDMRDMLLLDPIHDVEESGWPVPKTTD